MLRKNMLARGAARRFSTARRNGLKLPNIAIAGSGLLTRAGGLLRSLAAQGFPRLSPCVGGSSIILPRRLDTPV